ncbi:hypothetical protein RQN30_03595 [Arcanobacterium hippocoleae]
MRISTTILGILSFILGLVCIYAGIGGYIDGRKVIVGTLILLAIVIAAAALVPQKRNESAQPKSESQTVEN